MASLPPGPAAAPPAPGALETRDVDRIDLGAGTRGPGRDQVIEEAPLEIRARGRLVATVMRTPGADVELVRGLLWSEGALGASVSAAAAVAVVQHGSDIVDADVDPGQLAARSLVASAACGVCGRAGVADLEARAREVASELIVDADVVIALPDRLRAAQALFDATGGLHAAGLFDASGTPVVIREDVGRHNAVDKVVGWAVGAGALPAGAAILALSGRLGYELAQKAVMAGIPVIAAVGAPTTLALAIAERFRVAACGFVRDRRATVYCHGWRVRST